MDTKKLLFGSSFGWKGKLKKKVIICLVLKESLRLNTSVALNHLGYRSYQLFQSQNYCWYHVHDN